MYFIENKIDKNVLYDIDETKDEIIEQENINLQNVNTEKIKEKFSDEVFYFSD